MLTRDTVLSRTLFVGGVSGSANEEQLMDYISRYARVQSCIVNHDKRHAFLKLISHQDAINAKQAMDSRPEAEYRHLFERVSLVPCPLLPFPLLTIPPNHHNTAWPVWLTG
jgi:RNA recognition motif-containing protein